MIKIPTNEYQTPITDELLDSLPNDIRNWLLEAVETIPFVKELISPNRKRAKDLPRDERGRVIVDLAHPHILENMDYFREAGLHYQKYGCYTFMRPNKNKTSPYYKWITREKRRCWEGMVRPEDGEWIPGPMYFAMNYHPMLVNITNSEGNKTASRVSGFASWWEGWYWRFHYLEQARFGGIYNNWKGGEHAIELAKRGCGKSNCLSAIMCRNLFFGESSTAYKNINTILAAYQKEYLAADKDGTMNKFIPAMDFVIQNTEFPRLRLKDSSSSMTWQMGYIDGKDGTRKGTLNRVMAVSCKDDEDKLRGKRGWILIEELGSFPKLKDTYNVVRRGVEDGDYAFGMIYMVGTSSDKDSSFLSAQQMLYSPKGYRIYSLPNVYDKLNSGRPTFGFFFPAYINRAGCYDKDGNSDVIKALLEIFESRYNAKYNTNGDVSTIGKVISEDPITPAEAIVKASENIFPIQDLSSRLEEIDSNPGFYDNTYVCDLVFKGDKVEMDLNTPLTPIRDFGGQNNKMEGAIEIYELPQRDNTGKIPAGRYLSSLDPIEDDTAETSSLFSLFVLDTFTDRIVCEYTGRPMFASEGYERIRRMCLFYNCKLLYESNKKGIFQYFAQMNSTYLLLETPQYLVDKEVIGKIGYGNKAYGVNATKGVLTYGRKLLKDWLSQIVVTNETKDGEVIEVQKPRLFSSIKGRATIQELLSWNPRGNFDRVSSLIILMIYREQIMVMYGGNLSGQAVKRIKAIDDEDDFFARMDRQLGISNDMYNWDKQ